MTLGPLHPSAQLEELGRNMTSRADGRIPIFK